MAKSIEKTAIQILNTNRKRYVTLSFSPKDIINLAKNDSNQSDFLLVNFIQAIYGLSVADIKNEFQFNEEQCDKYIKYWLCPLKEKEVNNFIDKVKEEIKSDSAITYTYFEDYGHKVHGVQPDFD